MLFQTNVCVRAYVCVHTCVRVRLCVCVWCLCVCLHVRVSMFVCSLMNQTLSPVLID